jgi:hypothetical protein
MNNKDDHSTIENTSLLRRFLKESSLSFDEIVAISMFLHIFIFIKNIILDNFFSFYY